MKLISFKRNAVPSFGMVAAEGIIDLPSKMEHIKSLKEFLTGGSIEDAREIARTADADFAWEDVELLPVLPDPDKIFMVALNYEEHRVETRRDRTEYPSLFLRLPASQIAHGAPVIRPFVSDKLDYEGELAVIIGEGGRHISEERSMRHVAGYACYNDVTVRDWQAHTPQFTPGKNFSGTGAFGPWMVSADTIENPFDLALVTRLNGREVQRTNTNLMIHSMPRLISYCSTIVPLAPGDVIVTGTCGGVGARREPPLFMKHGDVVEVEIEQVGLLSNVVQDEARP